MDATPASHPADTPAPGRPRFAVVLRNWRGWWRNAVLATIDQEEVIAGRREDAYISARYLFMLAMSAGIAVLGLLLSSPAVVIGAMLIAPLMGPIIGAGFALAIGDYRWLQKSGYALAAGTVLAVALTALVVALSPLQTVTPEIAARTRPNLFDLGVAVFSALAGSYSMIRGREGAIVGVAIATALMPPLAVVGFGIATLNWTVFSGALLLFVTNLMTIALVATVMARIYGFSARLSDRQTRWQTIIIVVVFVALAIPLALSLRQIVWETNAARLIRGAVMAGFESDARLSQVDFDLESDPITVDATVLTPELKPSAQQAGERALEQVLGAPVQLRLTPYKVGTPAQAEQAQLAAAATREERTREVEADTLAAELALVAGVTPDAVTLDRTRRRAIVRAAPLPGADLAAYRELERRIATRAAGWTVAMQPPQLALPQIPFENGAPTVQGRQALALVVWAARRTGAPIALVGGDPATREVAATILGESRISPALVVGGPVMQARWGTGQ